MTLIIRKLISIIALVLVALLDLGCNLDPKYVITSHHPLERLTPILNKYKSNPLSEEERQLLMRFVARTKLESTFTKSRETFCGDRLWNLIAVQREWEDRAHDSEKSLPGKKTSDEVNVTWSTARLEPGIYVTQDLWPEWFVDRLQIQARLQNHSNRPVRAVSGTILFDDDAGNLISCLEIDLNILEERGAITSGGDFVWSWLLEVDRFVPLQKVIDAAQEERRESLRKAFEAFVDINIKRVEINDSIETLEKVLQKAQGEEARRFREELQGLINMLSKVETTANSTEQQVRNITGQNIGEAHYASKEGTYYVPLKAIDLGPRQDLQQVLPMKFIASLGIRWRLKNIVYSNP